MPPIKPLGVHPVEVAHALGQIGVGGFEDEMIMIGHQTIGMTPPMKPLTYLGVDLKKRGAIGIIEENILPSIPACRDMIQSTRIFNAKGSSHGRV